jgi:hypothetical protein
MSSTFAQTVDASMTFLVTAALVAFVLAMLVRRLQRDREGLSIGAPIAAGLVLRVAMAAAVSLTAYGTTLRGGDEEAFVFRADLVGATPFGSEEWLSALTREFHVFVLAVQRELFGSTDLALRVTEAGFAMAGIALLAVAVYELADGRSATIAAWVLALEPTSVFFSTLIHKESLLILAIGLVAYGGARMWNRLDPRALLPMALGVAIAATVRGYVSWFLLVAAAAVTLHAGIRGARQGSARAFVALSVVAIAAAVTVPAATGEFTEESLHRLDVSQRANARDESNLQLEAVDFSSGTGIVTNLPTRLREITFRPYPWELSNVSQQLGLLGTLVVLISLYLLAREIVRNWGAVMSRAGPLVYLASSLLLAYALAAGNAGTAFRYRVQVVAVVLCIIVLLMLASGTERARNPSKAGDQDRSGRGGLGLRRPLRPMPRPR